MGLTLVTPPASYPVTLLEAKAQVGVHASETAYDDQINGYIAAATSLLDGPNGRLGKAIMPQTWDLSLDEFSDAIEIPLGPVTAVGSVKYFDTEGDQQTLDAAYYTTDLSSNRQWVVLNTDYSWPDILDGVNAVTVRFTAGMSDNDLPAIKQAILGYVDHWFQPIGPNNQVQYVERMVDALIGPKRAVFL